MSGNTDFLNEIIKEVNSAGFMDNVLSEDPEPEELAYPAPNKTPEPAEEEFTEVVLPPEVRELPDPVTLSEKSEEDEASDDDDYNDNEAFDDNELPPEKPKKSKKKLIIILAIVAVVVIAVAGLCVYMFGGLTHDSEVSDLSDEELSVTTTDGVLSRGTEPSTTPDTAPEVSQEPEEEEEEEEEPYTELETDPDDPAVGITELPEDVQVAIGKVGYSGTSTYTTSYLKPGYEDIQTFVLYGLDEIGISDAIILCTLDPIHHKIKLTSIARDTYVVYADRGYSSKINHAFRWGGAAYAIQILNENFSLNVTDYISIDFSSMEDLIDFFGGVEVDVDYAEWKFMNNPAIEIGKTTLDGKFGLKYCRIRTIDSDIVRQSRQQEVLMSMYNKAREISPTYYPALIRQVAKMTTTSFDVSDLISMSDILLDDELTLETHSIPGDGTVNAWGGTIYGGWYYIYDLDYASDYIYQVIYEDYYVSGYDAEAVDAYEKENGYGKYAAEGTEDASTTVRGINQ